jgi:hypothetical protein
VTIPTPVAPGLELAFRADVVVAPVVDLGVTAAGHRRFVPILGGRFEGALAGEVQPGGADVQLLRADGAVEVEATYVVRTDGGDLVLVRSRGVRAGPPGVVEALLAGADVDPAAYYFRVALRLETGAPALAPLQDRIFVGSAVRTADHVRYDAYQVT